MAPPLGLVLAGGLSRRMGGGDKPLRSLGGRTLLDRVVSRFSPQCGAGVILNANGDAGRFLDFPGAIVPDGVPDHPGPLAGILAGLDHAERHHPGATHVASVSGDAPFLPLDLVARLTAALDGDSAAIAIASSGGHAHFTIGLWPLRLRDDLCRYLVEEEGRRVGAFLKRHYVCEIEWPTRPYDPFLNLNTPEDLEGAEAILPLVDHAG